MPADVPKLCAVFHVVITSKRTENRFVCTATLPFLASNNLPNPLGIATQTHRFHYISFLCTGLSVSDEHTQQEDAGWKTKALYQSSHCRQLR